MKLYESAFAVAIDDRPGSVNAARQQCHDQVIANTGSTRRSGVRWSYWSPAGEAQLLLAADGLDVVLPPEVESVCAVFSAGVLVMATVEIEV